MDWNNLCKKRCGDRSTRCRGVLHTPSIQYALDPIRPRSNTPSIQYALSPSRRIAYALNPIRPQPIVGYCPLRRIVHALDQTAALIVSDCVHSAKKRTSRVCKIIFSDLVCSAFCFPLLASNSLQQSFPLFAFCALLSASQKRVLVPLRKEAALRWRRTQQQRRSQKRWILRPSVRHLSRSG